MTFTLTKVTPYFILVEFFIHCREIEILSKSSDWTLLNIQLMFTLSKSRLSLDLKNLQRLAVSSCTNNSSTLLNQERRYDYHGQKLKHSYEHLTTLSIAHAENQFRLSFLPQERQNH